jgi:hypothetical protein
VKHGGQERVKKLAAERRRAVVQSCISNSLNSTGFP